MLTELLPAVCRLQPWRVGESLLGIVEGEMWICYEPVSKCCTAVKLVLMADDETKPGLGREREAANIGVVEEFEDIEPDFGRETCNHDDVGSRNKKSGYRSEHGVLC
jgi:hypothetical protein